MTIETTTSRASFAGNGSTTAFATGFKFFADGDLTVILVVDSTGVETTQTITTNYTVSGAGVDSGGTVTMVTAPASGETLVIVRSQAYTQTLDLVENDPFPSESVEERLDKNVIMSQQLNDAISRSIQLSDGDVSGVSLTMPTFVADQLLGVDTAGTALEMKAALAIGDSNPDGIIVNNAGTLSGRTITGTAGKITVTNGDGTGGNPTLSLGSSAVQTTAAQTLTNKTIALGSNTVSGTFAELNSAVTDATLVDLDDTQTLANKTLNGVNMSGTLTVGGNVISLDPDGDTQIVSSTDDEIDFKIANVFDFKMLGNIFRALSGSELQSDTLNETTSAAGVTVDGLLIKDESVVFENSASAGALFGGFESSVAADASITFGGATNGGLFIMRDASSGGVSVAIIDSGAGDTVIAETQAGRLKVTDPGSSGGGFYITTTGFTNRNASAQSIGWAFLAVNSGRK